MSLQHLAEKIESCLQLYKPVLTTCGKFEFTGIGAYSFIICIDTFHLNMLYNKIHKINVLKMYCVRVNANSCVSGTL